MSVKRFRTKPVEIEAVQWLGDLSVMKDFVGPYFVGLEDWERGVLGLPSEFTGQVYDILHETWISVKNGQWIVKGALGEFYPCDDATFHWKYEEIE